MNASLHQWRFFSAGGFDQVRLDRGSDLVHLRELDQKLWVALSCPTQGLEMDAQTLALVDTDADGHVRVPELIAAIDWATARLKSADTLIQGGPLALDAIDESRDEGRRILASARRILQSLGKPDANAVTVDDCGDSARIFAGMPANGDGVITGLGQDEDVQQALQTIVDTLGGVADRSGDQGVNQAAVDRFFDEGAALVAWRDQPQAVADLEPLGRASADACAALNAVRAKIDDYFTRCELAAFDDRAQACVNGSEDQLRGVSAQLLSAGSADLAALPLAHARAGAALSLGSGLNPAWADRMAAFRSAVVQPLLGQRDMLSAADWGQMKARFAAYEQWTAQQPVTVLDALDAQHLKTLVHSDMRARLNALIAADTAVAGEVEAIDDVHRLARYTRDLARLANNFVSFTDFYTHRDKASFQAGTLYLDGRSCDLCVKVLDAGKHAALASLSGVYLAYCECRRGAEKMQIAAAFTAGDSDQLMVGRNGVFYDRQGRDWDATIIKIIDHPISIWQAFWSPYKKAARMAAEQAQKFASTRAKASDDLTARAVSKLGDKVVVPAPGTPGGPAPAAAPAAAPANAPANAPAPAPFDAGKFAGIFAAIGLAIGAIGTAFASVVTGFLGLKAWQIPLALAGVMLLISGPAMALAYFKLRKRNLGPILDANGWAVNTCARINIPFGSSLTQTAKLPPGAERALTDPYAEKKVPWKLWLFVLAVLLGGAVYWYSAPLR